MNLLDAALAYAKHGYSVIPVSQDKRPLVKWEAYQKSRATEDEIRKWFSTFGNPNIGIVTGEISNLFVVDADTSTGIKTINDAIPDGLAVPVQSTPKTGKHFFFSHEPGMSNRVRVAEGIDIRTSGGYVVVSPSVNGNGKSWSWLPGSSILEISPPPLPDSLFRLLCGDLKPGEPSPITESYNITGNYTHFHSGTRDNDLFTIANALVRARIDQKMVRQVIEILAQNCNPPFSEKEANQKVESAIKRAEIRERSVTNELRDYLDHITGDYINITEAFHELQILHKNDILAARVAIHRMCHDGMLERIENRSGMYRIVDKNIVEQQWWAEEGDPLSLKFPLGIHELVKIYPGSLILIEGQKSQGKSAFALEFCRMNRKIFPTKKIRYQNVEMTNSELKERFENYPEDVIKPNEWKESIEFIKKTSDWWDLIDPDGLNVIDYLIEYKESYLIADYIFKIHKKMNKGMALVIIQRDPYKPYGVGGRGVRDIPRLIISLLNHIIKIEDCKSFRRTPHGNPSGLSRRYAQASWWKFTGITDWAKDLMDENSKQGRRDYV